MKKVIYVLNSTYLLGGASKSFLWLLKGMIQRGVCPVVVVPDRKGLYSILVQMGAEVIDITYRNNTYPHFNSLKDVFLFIPRLFARRLVNWKAVRKLYTRFSNCEISLVHTNVSVVDIGFRLAKKLCIPHIYHIREYADLDFHEYYYPSSKVFHRVITSPYSFVICITEGVLAHHRLNKNERVKVIYNGIVNGKPDNIFEVSTNYLLYAGRIEKTKGLDLLLEAYSAYLSNDNQKEKFELLVAGDISDNLYYNSILDLIINKGIKDHVHFLGPRKDIYDLMKNAKAIVIPSRSEAFGRCMAEAMFNGCLVIGYDYAGTKEQFDNGVKLTGKEIGLRFISVKELIRILNNLGEMSETEIHDMKVRAAQTVSALYSVDSYVSEVYNFYEEILDENINKKYSV